MGDCNYRSPQPLSAIKVVLTGFRSMDTEESMMPTRFKGINAFYEACKNVLIYPIIDIFGSPLF
jgi:hypothetical protein